MLSRVIKLAQYLVSRHSISPFDDKCQEIIIKHLKTVGFTVECMNFNRTKNFWAWRGHGKTLVFAGHTDVVSVGNIEKWTSPPFEPTIRNGMLFGRGVIDMKGSLAAMVIAAECFINNHPNHLGRLAFLITSDEEAEAKDGTVKVVKALMARNEHVDYCLIGEPSSIKSVGDVIKNGRRGSLTCNLVIYGTQGHIAYPNLADNPIHRAIPMLNELINIKWDSGNKFFPPTTMQIINVHAGNNCYNIIPDNFNIKFNFRFNTQLTDKIIKERVLTLLKKYRLNYDITWCLAAKPFLTQHGELIDTVSSVIENYTQTKPQLLNIGGTSDGRFIACMGAQIVELGLVSTTMHKIDECVNLSDLQILTLMYLSIMEKLIA